MTRKLFVTTALPYANAPFHIGHMMEYIQADIWVRFQRMNGAEVHFVGADDAHGAPIMIAAEKQGKTPQAFVAEIAAGRAKYLDGFHIAFDNWSSTDSPENHALAREIYLALRKNELIDVKTIEQFFDPVKSMFLPDRFIKGECPRCGTKDQYGDSCENCGAVYNPTELKNPYSALSGAVPVLRSSEHYFFRLSDPRCLDFLQKWTTDTGRLQPEVLNKIKEWFHEDPETGAGGLRAEGVPRISAFRTITQLPIIGIIKTCDAIGRELMRNGRIMRYTAPDDFGAPETAFLACNFWYIDALYQIGRKDEARELFESILARRNAYGLLSEDIHPDAGELWGNIPQTYSMAGIINSATRLSSSWEEAWARD